MKATLVVLAAGLGSRFGGYKQIEGFGPSGEILLEYSVYDAIKAGFSKIVFIIKPEMQDTIEKLVLSKVRGTAAKDGTPVELCCVYQDYSSIPSFYQVPAGRTKPFGTGHALLCARSCVQEPFAILNADDYYGPQALEEMYGALCTLHAGEAVMVGYLLKNTVSRFGAVTRGVCSHRNGLLTDVKETFGIRILPDGTIRDTATSDPGEILDPDAVVSMNFWGFTPEIFGYAQMYFDEFLRCLDPEEIKKEYLLPVLVDLLIKNGRLKVRMLKTDSVWFGVTYREDQPYVEQELRQLHKAGVYPSQLWNIEQEEQS